MTMVQTYCPDPDDSDLVFNIPTGSAHLNLTFNQKFYKEMYVIILFCFIGSDQKSIENELSDSDEAPDDVPFSKAKNEALSLRKAEELVQKLTKEKQKKRRQQNEALMREQKEDKTKRLQAIASKRLPLDLVDDVSAQPIQPSPDSRKKLKKGTGSEEVSRVHTSIYLKLY